MMMPSLRPSVLLVDDLEANLIALEAQLASIDCDLVRAKSGNEALHRLLKRDFAVMLLDAQMPEMDGFEVARLARENTATASVPIIFVTAMLETEQSVLQGYGSGAVDFLFKPINPYVLRSKVQIFLDLYRGRQRLAQEIESHKRTMADLDAFNYSVSHDLRAPLRAIDGFGAALVEDYEAELPPKGREYIARIRSAAQRMGQLIDDLLRLSRISRAHLRPQTVDLTGTVEMIATELRTTEPGRTVDLLVEPGISAAGDANLMRVALENLLRNAWKFTRRTTSPRIEFGARIEDETVYFVRDNGAGFDPAFADKLFKPFQRLHSISDFEGTGIGLAIVRRIIAHHGGRIWAESGPEQGATFFFTLGRAVERPSSDLE